MNEKERKTRLAAAVSGFVSSGVGSKVDLKSEIAKLKSFTCSDCGKTSHNPNDVKNRYCGNCHKFQNSSS